MIRRMLLPVACLLASVTAVLADGPVRVTISDNANDVQEIFLPVDPKILAQMTYSTNMVYGLQVENKRLTLATSARTNIRLEGQSFVPTNAKKSALPPGPNKKQRVGTQYTWSKSGINVTQVLEVVPGKPSAKPKAGEKRRMDTLLVRYTLENTDTKAHKVGVRLRIDTYCWTNDGCLFASPEKFPDKILDGVELKDKDVPAYLQILQNNNLKNPGWVAHFTLRFGPKFEGPNRVVLTHHGVADNGWDTPAQPANGDSEAAFFWDEKLLKPGEKRELAFAHGQGIASNPENEGLVSLELGGAFEPGKQFTILARVDDPQDGQALTLDLPPGLTRIEGKPTQAVPPPGADGRSVVMWKVQVDKLGDNALKVRSSSGVTYNTSLKIEAAARAELIRIPAKGAPPDEMAPGKKKQKHAFTTALSAPTAGPAVPVASAATADCRPSRQDRLPATNRTTAPPAARPGAAAAARPP
jgi:hypothetical protein